MRHESKRLMGLVGILAILALTVPVARGAIVFTDNFNDGDISDWKATGNGTWSASTQWGINVAMHTAPVVGRLEHRLDGYTSGDFTLEFEYNWRWGASNNGLRIAAGLMDEAGNEVKVGLLQGAGRYHFISGVGTIWGPGMALTGIGGGGSMQRARLRWDSANNTLWSAYWNGSSSSWVNSWPTGTTGATSTSFTKVALWSELNFGAGHNALFDNVSLDATLVPEPQILTLLGLLGGLVLRRRR